MLADYILQIISLRLTRTTGVMICFEVLSVADAKNIEKPGNVFFFKILKQARSEFLNLENHVNFHALVFGDVRIGDAF